MFLAGKRKLVHVLRTRLDIRDPRDCAVARKICKSYVNIASRLMRASQSGRSAYDRNTYHHLNPRCRPSHAQLGNATYRLKLAINHRVYNRAADICSPRMCTRMEIVEDITRILRVLVEEFERWRFNFRRARVRRLKALCKMRNSLTRSSLLSFILISDCWHDFLFVFLKNIFWWN